MNCPPLPTLDWGRGDRPKHQTLSQTRGHDRHNSPWYTRWWGVPATSAASHNPASGGVQTDEPGRRGGGGTHADSPRCRCRCRHKVALGHGSSLSPAPCRLDPPAPTSTRPPGAVRSSPPILGLGLVSSHPPWPCSVGGRLLIHATTPLSALYAQPLGAESLPGLCLPLFTASGKQIPSQGEQMPLGPS